MPPTREPIYTTRDILNQAYDPATNSLAMGSTRQTTVFTLHASAAETANGQSTGVDLATYAEALAELNVTAVAGTSPTMTVSFQTSDDNADWYNLGDAFAGVTAVAKPNALRLTNVGRYLRAVWTIGGTTPSFTFTLKLVAKT